MAGAPKPVSLTTNLSLPRACVSPVDTPCQSPGLRTLADVIPPAGGLQAWQQLDHCKGGLPL
jgi:hypothetical protein